MKLLLGISKMLYKTECSHEKGQLSRETEEKSNWHFNKFSLLLLSRTYKDDKWEFEYIDISV